MKKSILILFLILFFSWQGTACAEDLWVLNEQLTIQGTNNNLTIHRTLNSRELHNDEFARGNDLSRAIRDLMLKVRDTLALLKGRRMDQMRATEIARIAESNARDTIRRNEVAQQLQQSAQRSLMQDLRMKTRDLNQRIRDLSR